MVFRKEEKMCKKRTGIFVGILAICVFLSLTLAFAEERFIDNGDGTVTDRLLKVMWGKADNQGDVDWKAAEHWVKSAFPNSLPSEKREGWRLPTMEELQTLYSREPVYEGYKTVSGRRVMIAPDIKLSSSWIWTSDKKKTTAVLYNFERGYHYLDRMDYRRGNRALPVRSLAPSK
jgi:hypothetical protein